MIKERGLKQIIRGALSSGTTAPSPEIEVYPAEGENRKTGIIVFPGGGYGGLAEHEGKGYAEYMAAVGFTCFVVKYRLGSAGHRHPAMLEDALAAIHTVRAGAATFGIESDRIGVMGSSAGGHLTAHALVGWPAYGSEVSLRPDFGVLCYPVILSTGEHSHKGSMRNLLGEHPDEALLKSVSCETGVTSDTPPTFLWHTNEDAGVPMENSVAFAMALRQADVPFELHIYQKGRHGLGLGTAFDWAGDCVRWLGETLD